ncbi:hypothetical protein, partial [Pseudoalteromonas sp.]|uniref:hypothetical protein n=1 Tax=Pseudoalteromonas sp. TaxID=53249 RepID=UPI0026245F0C
EVLQKGCKMRNISFVSGGWREAEFSQARERGGKIFQKPFKIIKIEAWLKECEKSVRPDRVLAEW